jgi:twitching motility protein PilT
LAVERGASDVILSPETKPSIKIDWEITFLENYDIYTKDELNKDILSIMNESQKSSFINNMELDFALELRWYSRFRWNAFMQKNGFWIVFRPIKSKLQELWLPKRIIDFTKKKAWLVIVTWAVWSGKSTTLATLIEHINNTYSKHIITVEDPIEYVFANNKSIIEQREISMNTKDFDSWLKYALRQSSDVIMVWEMRDLETFRLALRAAETGNLVFATMHTSWAAESISRIVNMFPEGEKEQIRTQVSEVLVWVVWQTLVKKIWWGRVAAIELLVNNTTIWNMIRKWLNHQIDWVIETWKEDWMITMKKSLEELYMKWLISEEEYRESQENKL